MASLFGVTLFKSLAADASLVVNVCVTSISVLNGKFFVYYRQASGNLA